MLQLAVKYATRARKRLLADRLTDMAQKLIEEQRQEEEEDEVEVSSFDYHDNGFAGTASEASRRSVNTSQRSFQHNNEDDRDMFACTPPVLEVEGNLVTIIEFFI